MRAASSNTSAWPRSVSEYRTAEITRRSGLRGAGVDNRGGQTGDVLAHHQKLASRRGEQVVVQAAVQDLAAKEAREDGDTAEEDDRPQHERLEDDAVDLAGASDALAQPIVDRQDRHQAEERDRHQSQQVGRNCRLDSPARFLLHDDPSRCQES